MTDNIKPIITLVGTKQSKLNFTFLYEGPLGECKACPIFKICGEKLEIGRIYKVTSIRDKVFPCPLHEEGVQVVAVSESKIETNIENRLAFLGGIITFQPPDCYHNSCLNYEKCVPKGLKKGDKCKILKKNEGSVLCLLNLHLVGSVLQRLDREV